MVERCKFPECGHRAEKTWALVPVCSDHHRTIHAETMRFYRGTLKVYADRVEYLKIAKLIPWSRVNMGEVLPNGSVRRD